MYHSKSVSYTHLDVYKRQLLFTAKGMGVGITFTTLQNCSESIENYILSGNKLTEENIETIVGESYIDYIIEDRVSNKVYILSLIHI